MLALAAVVSVAAKVAGVLPSNGPKEVFLLSIATVLKTPVALVTSSRPLVSSLIY